MQMHGVTVVPRVSVLMPVFNAGPFVREAVQSVLAQTFCDFELVAIDDGSRDDSLATLRGLERTDPRMRVLSRENRGLIATRNELVREARGELVAWMDADDVSYPERLATLVQAFDREPSLLCMGTAVLQIDPEGMPLARDPVVTDRAEIRRKFAAGGAVTFGTSMMRRNAIVAVGGFRAPFLMGEDLDLILRLAEIGEIGNIDACLLMYRRQMNSTSRQHAPRWDSFLEAILELAEERKATGTDRLQRGEEIVIRGSDLLSIPRSEHVIHLQWSRQSLAAGFQATARKHAIKAIEKQPASLDTWRNAIRVALARPPKDV